MKQLRLTLSSGEYLLVEPDEVLVEYIMIAEVINPLWISLAGYRCKLIGQLFGISEPLKSEILEGIRKEGWYTVNPYANPKITWGKGITQKGREEFKELLNERRVKAEARTLDPDKTYCFKILK